MPKLEPTLQVNPYLTLDTSRESLIQESSYLGVKRALVEKLSTDRTAPNRFYQLRELGDDWMGWAQCSDQITDVVHIGIGGSVVGARALASLLAERAKPTIKLHFVSGLDARELHDVLEPLDAKTTLTYVVSKSMTSLEPLANFSLALQFYNNDFSKIRAVTAYPDRALELGFLSANIQSFPTWVSGRFSVWGACSASLVTVFGAQPFKKFLQGARYFDQDWLARGNSFDASCRLALMDALKNSSGCLLKLIGVYGYRLRHLPDYFMQLHMESLGKCYQSSGAPLHQPMASWLLSMVGTELQHSVSQMVMQGGQEISVDWVVADSQPELKSSAIAQSEVLYQGYDHADSKQCIEGGRGSTLIMLRQLSPECMGALMALYEYKVYVIGEYAGVNVFDQWGVERAKSVLASMDSIAVPKN